MPFLEVELMLYVFTASACTLGSKMTHESLGFHLFETSTLAQVPSTNECYLHFLSRVGTAIMLGMYAR